MFVGASFPRPTYLVAEYSERKRRRNTWLILCLAAVSLFGMATDFHASPEWSKLGDWIALGCGIPTGILLARWVINHYPGTLSFRQKLAATFGLCCTPVVFCLAIVGRALPDLYTRLAGTPFTLVQMGHKTSGSGRGWWLFCRHAVDTPGFPRGSDDGTGHLCVSRAEFDALPDHSEIRIRGRESWFGRRVDRLEPLD